MAHGDLPRLQTGIKGIVQPLDLTQLIDRIVIGPRAEQFFVQAVAAIADKFLPQLSVNQSTLLHRPIRVSR
jgi:hypothetical protein